MLAVAAFGFGVRRSGDEQAKPERARKVPYTNDAAGVVEIYVPAAAVGFSGLRRGAAALGAG